MNVPSFTDLATITTLLDFIRDSLVVPSHFAFLEATIFTSMLLLRFAFAKTLISPNWRHLRSGPSSLALKSPAALASSSISRSVPALIPRTITPSPRMFTTSIFLSSSSSPENIGALEKKIGALEHLLKGGNSTTACSDEIRDTIRIYEGGDKSLLLGILNAIQEEKTAIQRNDTALQEEKTAIQRKDTALQEEKTALAISKASVESKGSLSLN